MPHLRHLAFFLWPLALAGRCCADPESEAEQLKNQAVAILKANADKETAPEQYAVCLFKLEKAKALAESVGKSDSTLGQEISAILFWARRFSNVLVLAALDKLKSTEPPIPALPPPPPPAKTPPGPQPQPQPGQGSAPVPPEMSRMNTAAKAFAEAEKFAAARAKDDYAVAMRWFLMANQYPGTGYALKALDLARRARQRFAGKAVEEELPDGKEMEPAKEADTFASTRDYEQAIPLYKVSLKRKETVIVHKRLGQAYYAQAQQLMEVLKPRLEAHLARYSAAWLGAWHNRGGTKFFESNDPGLANWNRQNEQLRKESDEAQRGYQEAEQEFRLALKLSPGQQDFDAAGYVGLCQGVRPFFRMTGLQTLRDFLKNYTPLNDNQRLMYEFCKTEVDRLYKGG